MVLERSNLARLMGRDNGEYNYVDFVEISKIFLKQDAFLFVTERVDGVYSCLSGVLTIS